MFCLFSYDKLAGKSGPLEPAAPWSLFSGFPAPRVHGDSFGNEGLPVGGPTPEAGRLEPSLPGEARLA